MKQERVAIYCRVSTDRQETSNQVIELKQYIARRTEWKLSQVYEEQASGADDGRPVLARLVQDGKQNKFDVLLVWRLDRLGRSTLKILSVLSELSSAGVAFISSTEGFDTTSPHGKMLLVFLSAICEYERSVTKERIALGLARCRSEGQILGRPRVGFDLGKAIALKNDGLGYRRIAKRLGVSHSTVFRSLQAVSKTLVSNQPVSVS